MSLFRQSQIQKHTPKTITMPDLYQHLMNRNNLSNSDKIDIMKALKMSGYDYSSASKILSGEMLDISKAKEVASNLSRVGLRGFAKNDANLLVDQYIRKEAIKSKNLAGRRRELMLEALQEDIDKDKATGLKYPNSSSNPKAKNNGGRRVKLGF